MKTKDLELKLVDLQTKVDKMNLLYSIDFNPVIEKKISKLYFLIEKIEDKLDVYKYYKTNITYFYLFLIKYFIK